MGINISNFLSSKSKSLKMNEFQDLDHLDGLSISTVSANLYKTSRDSSVAKLIVYTYSAIINSGSYKICIYILYIYEGGSLWGV